MTKLSSKWTLTMLVAFFAVAIALMPEMAFAQEDVGQSVFEDVQRLIQGNLGVLAGLLISLFGLWMWLVQQSSWGLLIVIAGAALTAFPGIYGSLADGFDRAFTADDTEAGTAANRASN